MYGSSIPRPRRPGRIADVDHNPLDRPWTVPNGAAQCGPKHTRRPPLKRRTRSCKTPIAGSIRAVVSADVPYLDEPPDAGSRPPLVRAERRYHRRVFLAQVESFLEVVRTGSLTLAADALFVAQPTLTERLKALEVELGKPLFARTRRYGLQLTAAGEAFLPHAERMVLAAREGVAAVARADRNADESIIIAAASIVGTPVLAETVARLRSSDARPSIDIRAGTASEVVKMVLRKQVDLGLTRPVRNAQIEQSPLYVEEILPVVARGHRLDQAGSIHARAIAAEPIIVVSETVTYEYIQRAITRGGGSPSLLPMQVSSVDIARGLVEQRAGIAFLPYGSVAQDLRDGELTRLRIVDLAPIHVRVTMLRRFDARPESRAIEDFITDIREVGARLEQDAIESREGPRSVAR